MTRCSSRWLSAAIAAVLLATLAVSPLPAAAQASPLSGSSLAVSAPSAPPAAAGIAPVPLSQSALSPAESGSRKSHVAVEVFLALALTALSIIVWFICVFTTDLGVDIKEALTNKRLHRMILFCYVFTFVTIFIAALPFVLMLLPPNTTRALYSDMIESPIALGLGCVHDTRPEDAHWEVVCGQDNYADQWLINIGGYTQAKPILPGSGDGVDQNLNGLVYFFPRMIVHGGITVPFYFVFISLIGAAVSMTRRIPEYQTKLLDPKDSLIPPEARQKMVFQILQFVSAPFIAITAYVLITPASPTSSVAIAFTAGFSSEIVLNGISYIANRFEEFVSAAQPPVARHSAPTSTETTP